jgi:hypothetical protein
MRMSGQTGTRIMRTSCDIVNAAGLSIHTVLASRCYRAATRDKQATRLHSEADTSSPVHAKVRTLPNSMHLYRPAGVLFWGDGMHPSTMPRYDARFSLNGSFICLRVTTIRRRVHCQESHTRLLWCTRLACQFSTSSQSTSQHDRDQEAARTTR